MPNEDPLDRSQSDGEAQQRRSSQDQMLREALVSGLSYSEAAALCGCSARTVRRRMADPQFRLRLAEGRARRRSELCGKLNALEWRAVSTMGDCLDADSPGTRLRAAEAILNASRHARLEVELDDRLSVTERALRHLLNPDDAVMDQSAEEEADDDF